MRCPGLEQGRDRQRQGAWLFLHKDLFVPAPVCLLMPQGPAVRQGAKALFGAVYGDVPAAGLAAGTSQGKEFGNASEQGAGEEQESSSARYSAGCMPLRSPWPVDSSTARHRSEEMFMWRRSRVTRSKGIWM